MTIHIHLSLAPGLEVQEGVAYLLQVEITAVVAGLHDVGKFLRPFITLCKGKRRNTPFHLARSYLIVNTLNHIKCLDGSLVIIRDGDVCPVLRRQHDFCIVCLCRQGDITDDTFEVLDGTAEVDAAHAFDDDDQFGTLLDGRNRERFLVFHTVDFTNILPIDENLCKVVELSCEHALRSDLRQAGGVHHGAPTHIHLLKSLQGTIDWLGHGRQHGCELRQLKLRHGHYRHRSLGYVGELLVAVLLHHLTQFPELRCGLTILVDRSVIVVGSDIRGETRRVGTSPMAERGSTVSHVE